MDREKSEAPPAWTEVGACVEEGLPRARKGIIRIRYY